jgi:hypothetical protein
MHCLPVWWRFELLKNSLYEKAGVRVGKEGENDWIPDHELVGKFFER